ncbi:hypothetical protein WDW89_20785, partial [Deltaproteobacteria bacterium TL4]
MTRKTLKTLLDAYLPHKKVLDNVATYRSRQRCLNQWSQWMEERGMRWISEINQLLLEQWIQERLDYRTFKGTPLTSHQLRVEAGYLNHFLRHCFQQGETLHPLEISFDFPKLPQPLKAVLTVSELEALMDFSDTKFSHGIRQ